MIRSTDENLKRHGFDMISKTYDEILYRRTAQGMSKNEKFYHYVKINRHGSISSYRMNNEGKVKRTDYNFVSLSYNLTRLFMKKINEMDWKPGIK